MSDSLRPKELQHARLCPSAAPGACSNSCPSSQWCHPTISSSVVPFFSCLQSFPASRSFPMSQFFASGDQRIGASASASVLPMNTQDWFPLGWTGWISLQSKGLSRVFSNTTVQKHPRCDPRKGRAEGRQGKDDLGLMKSKTTQGWQAWQPTPVFLPGESYGQKSLASYRP